MQHLLNIVGYLFFAITFIASLLGKATCLLIFDAFLKYRHDIHLTLLGIINAHPEIHDALLFWSHYENH